MKYYICFLNTIYSGNIILFSDMKQLAFAYLVGKWTLVYINSSIIINDDYVEDLFLEVPQTF